MQTPLRLFLLIVLGVSPVWAADDWPHTRGPALDGRVAAPGTFESGHIGLGLSWKIPLGSGYSGIAVSDGKAVTMFAQGDGDWVAAFDVSTGETLWRHRIEAINKGLDGADDGPLSSPVIARDSVYAISARGLLVSLFLKDGKLKWSKHIDTDFGGRKPEYGFTTTPLVAGKVLVVQSGGDAGRAIVGLNAKNGKKIWSHGDGEVAYQSPALMTLAGKEQVVAVNKKGISGFAADSGKPLWERAFAEGERSGSASPAFVGEDRFLVPISGDAAVFKVSRDAGGFAVEELYRSKALGNNYAPPVYQNGHIYGYRGKVLTCIKASDGERVWRSREPGGDGLILVDRHLVIFGGLGNVVVAAASPEGYEEYARVQALDGSGLTWPSFAGGRVFVRNLSDMAAVAVTSDAAGMPRTDAPSDLEFSAWLKRAGVAAAPASLVSELFEAHEAMPIVEGEFVTFIFRGAVDDVAIAGTMIANDSTQPMQRVEGTDVFYRTFRLDPGVRWEYRFQIDFDEWTTDPLNPRVAPALDEEGEVSELVMPGYESSAVIGEPSGPRGGIETFTLESVVLETEKEIKVWLPPGYADSGRDYPTLIVNDGQAWIDKAMMINTLDNLVGKSVDPVIVAFVQPARRWWYEAGDSTIEGYLRMQVEELLPALRERYRLSDEPGVHGAMGNRYYASSAILLALKHPDVFGRVGVQSVFMSHDFVGLMKELLRGEPAAALSFYLDWNRYDERNVDREWDLGRDSASLASLLEQSGYRVAGGEAVDSLGWGGWRNRTDDLLVTLFPAR